MPVVPSLESLCLDVVANFVHLYEPASLAGALPYGGGGSIVERLIHSNRLRPETLNPLLADWSAAESVEHTIGNRVAVLAPGCRGLSQLAAQRLRFARANRGEQPYALSSALPEGTIRPGSEATCSAAALESR